MEGEKEGAGPGAIGKPSKLKDRLFSLGFMVALSAFFAVMIAGAKLLLAERIAVNENLFRQRKVLEALRVIPYGKEGGAHSGREIQELYGKRVRDLTGAESPLACYLGLSEDGSRVERVAVLSVWQGFWGRIEGVFTVTPEDRRLWGFSVFAHSETPGLGARMTEPEFRAQFFSGRMKVPESAKGGGQPLEVDAITGATRTTESIVKFLTSSLPELVDKLQAERARWQSAPESAPKKAGE